MRISIWKKGEILIYDNSKHVATVYRGDRKLALQMAAAPELLKAAKAALACLETPDDLTPTERIWVKVDLANAIYNAGFNDY